MIKKIFGIIFIIISIILGLGFLAGLPKTLGMLISNLSSYSIGYAVGSILFLIAGIFLFRLGLKWLKKERENIETIDQIGKN